MACLWCWCVFAVVLVCYILADKKICVDRCLVIVYILACVLHE